MMKQIEIRGQRIEVYSLDNGATWASNPQSILAYAQRKEMLRLQLRQSFERIEEIQEPAMNYEISIPKSVTGR